MIKYFFYFLISLFLGCGGSSSGGTDINSFNIKTFNPYTEPKFKYAWHLQRVSSEYASARNISANSSINIYDVWNQKIFGNGVKVAVIDYDFDSYHEDISSNVIATYDVDTNSSEVRKYASDHGTGAASLIASAYNGKGTIGVAPKAKLILIDANVSYNGSSDDASKIRAFYKAKELGAKVVSCGWGTLNVSFSVAQTIKELYDDNITVIFSSGNNRLDLDKSSFYNDESELDWVIGVGASTESNTKADYSNYGDNIDILAPGGMANGGTIAATYYNNYTDRYNGTSASAPIVAGVVALMLEANPNLTPSQIREILIKTADKIDPQNANYDNNGFSHTYAYGKVNASKAVSLAKTY